MHILVKVPAQASTQVGSKLDRVSSRAVTFEEGCALARRYGSSYCEVSSKTRENVKKPFLDLVDQIISSPELMASVKVKDVGRISVQRQNDPFSSGCSC